jgi:hypothetical protein
MIDNNIETQQGKSFVSQTKEGEQVKQATVSDLILKNQSQIIDLIRRLQQDVAMMCVAHHDLKSEYLEDVAEINTELQALRLCLQRSCFGQNVSE